MASLFSRIITREIPAFIVAEDTNHIAFLDINPNAPGHTLCVPKQEVNKLFDLDDAAYTALMQFSKRVANALRQTVPCKRIGLSVIGLEVPHVHVHLIPLNEMADASFQKKVELSNTEMTAMAKKILLHFEEIGQAKPIEINTELIAWVLENLIKNSIDAIRGKGEIRLVLSWNKSAHIVISDTGSGIPKNLQKKVFSPGETTKKSLLLFNNRKLNLECSSFT